MEPSANITDLTQIIYDMLGGEERPAGRLLEGTVIPFRPAFTVRLAPDQHDINTIHELLVLQLNELKQIRTLLEQGL